MNSQLVGIHLESERVVFCSFLEFQLSFVLTGRWVIQIVFAAMIIFIVNIKVV